MHINKHKAYITYCKDEKLIRGVDPDGVTDIPVAIAFSENTVIGATAFREEHKKYQIPLTPSQFVSLLDDSCTERILDELHDDLRVQLVGGELCLLVETFYRLRKTTLPMLFAIYVEEMISLIPEASRK
ncbi:hypothetical protein FO519_009590, partial [Halicephalobus sp. NKZ332]